MFTQEYPKSRQFKFTLTVGAVTVSLLLASAAILVYVFLGDRYENLRKYLEFSTAALATAAGATGAAYVGQELSHNTKASKIDRTLSYINRWNNPSFNKQKIIKLMRQVKKTPQEKLDNFVQEQLENDILKSELVTILNFFEEMSMVINQNLVEESILKDFFRGIINDYFSIFEAWILNRSNGNGNSNKYKELKALRSKWES